MSSPLANLADLAIMRAQAQELCPESWSLVHPTDVIESGGTTEVWTVSASGAYVTGNGGRLMPAGYQAQEAVTASRPGAAQAWTITLPAGTVVYPQDRVIIGTKLAVAVTVADADWLTYRFFECVGSTSGHTAESAVKVAALEVS